MIKIRMVDSVCFGAWHLRFNTQLLEMLAYSSDFVEYRGAQKIGINRSNVNFKKIFVIKSLNRWATISRLFVSAMIDLWQLFATPSCEIIIYSFDSTVSIRLINLFNKILNKRVIMFRHGSMEMLLSSSGDNGFIYKFERKLIRLFFLNPHLEVSSNLYFYVLGDVIKKNLHEYLSPNKMRHFLSIDLLSNFDNNYPLTRTNNVQKLSIGTVGVFSEYKGGIYLLKLAYILNTNFSHNINLSITGKIDFNLNLLHQAGINLPRNNGVEMVSPEEMKERISNLDFILYFYSNDTYRLTASGALFDAVNYKKPIIALRNEYFEYFFMKYGKLGYLVDTIEEMANLITRICNGDEKIGYFNFNEIQSKLTIPTLSEIFVDNLRKIEFIEK
jgi:hypothetical protein